MIKVVRVCISLASTGETENRHELVIAFAFSNSGKPATGKPKNIYTMCKMHQHNINKVETGSSSNRVVLIATCVHSVLGAKLAVLNYCGFRG